MLSKKLTLALCSAPVIFLEIFFLSLAHKSAMLLPNSPYTPFIVLALLSFISILILIAITIFKDYKIGILAFMASRIVSGLLSLVISSYHGFEFSSVAIMLTSAFECATSLIIVKFVSITKKISKHL